MTNSCNHNIYSHFAFSTKGQNSLFNLDDGTILTYAMVDKKVANYCNYFATLNLKPGDRIAAQTDKSVDAICIYLASLCYGTIYIPLNKAFHLEELQYFITDAEPALFICSLDKKTALEDLARQKNLSLIIEILDENNSASIHHKIQHLSFSFNIASKHPDDLAAILYTSGTTGKPKGAMLSHANLLNNGMDLVNSWSFKETDILLHMLPIFHCHGLFFASHCALLSGASMTFLPKFNLDLAIKHLPQSTVFMGVPTYYTRLLADERFTKNLATNIRLFISGSAPLLENTFDAFAVAIGQKILERYGMTETGINTSNTLAGDRIVGSVGIPLPSVTVRIVDGNGNKVATNNPGHIQVKGLNVFKGYWKKEDQTNESFTPDGYFKTGDIGKQNAAGYVSIIGRDKDMIITGGINVYPKEIEDLIDTITYVKESAVIGLPHPDFGEAVTALIVANTTKAMNDNDVITLTKSKLANYKVPKKVVFIDALPRNTMGKVQKNILRDKYKNLYEIKI